MARWHTKNAKQRPPELLEIEDAVREFQELSGYDNFLKSWYQSYIRDRTKKFLKGKGIRLDEVVEGLLWRFVGEFDYYSSANFFGGLLGYLSRQGVKAKKDTDSRYCSAYHGVSHRLFEQTGESSTERTALAGTGIKTDTRKNPISSLTADEYFSDLQTRLDKDDK